MTVAKYEDELDASAATCLTVFRLINCLEVEIGSRTVFAFKVIILLSADDARGSWRNKAP